MFAVKSLTSYFLCTVLCVMSALNSGAGILPYAFHKKTGMYYFLLGKEAYGKGSKNTWADFGGKMEPIDNGVFSKTALREFCEESGYPIKSQYWLSKQIEKNPVIKHPRNYYMYFAQLPYRQARTLKGDGEKSEFVWVPLNSFIAFLGQELYKKKRIPSSFTYEGRKYPLRKSFQACLFELLKQYDPKKESYYFRAKTPAKIFKRIMNIS